MEGPVDDDLAQVPALVLAHGVLRLQGERHLAVVTVQGEVRHPGVDGDERPLVPLFYAAWVIRVKTIVTWK